MSESSCEGEPFEQGQISIHVFGWRRPKSLHVLLQQLRGSYYHCWEAPVDLHLHVDGNASPKVREVASAFQWPHGALHLDLRSSNVGLREMWLSSLMATASKASPNSLMVVFEDDMRISIFWFQWLIRMIWKYGRNGRCRNAKLMGFSLSPIRWMEMRKPATRWRARAALPSSSLDNNAYLSVTPSSWGASYWADRWVEFDRFVRFRIQPPFYDLEEESKVKNVATYDELRMTPPELYIPGGCRSNVWPHSWKRFMVDFMFARGQLMLYPSFNGERGLASTLHLQGKHTLTKKRGSKEVMDDDDAADSGLKVPRWEDGQENKRVAELLRRDEALLNMQLPDFDDLQVFDLYMVASSQEKAVLEGQAFLEQLDQGIYGELVRQWQAPLLQRPHTNVSKREMTTTNMPLV